MGEVKWTAEAEHWLRDIYDYIAQDNPTAAGRTVLRIYERVEALVDFPEAGYAYLPRAGDSLRILLYGHYRIGYRVKRGGGVDSRCLSRCPRHRSVSRLSPPERRPYTGVAERTPVGASLLARAVAG